LAGKANSIMRSKRKKITTGLMLAVMVWLCGPIDNNAQAGSLDKATAIPHLDVRGQEGFQKYKAAPPYRAFAIASGGAWAWVSGYASTNEATAAAVAECNSYSDQKCLAYAADDQIVFDDDAWAASWGPYLSAAEAVEANKGVMIGNRFPDLLLIAPSGAKMALSDFKGRGVFLHFWGSWCPPCQVEFPELQKLYDVFSQTPGIDFVLVQARESIAKSRQWAKRRGITMPLYDSGMEGRQETNFQLAEGETISDRRLAPAFPSTYVLDGNGIVVFAHAGRVVGWPGYEPLLQHIVKSVRAK
jgi:peroxiredoxin